MAKRNSEKANKEGTKLAIEEDAKPAIENKEIKPVVEEDNDKKEKERLKEQKVQSQNTGTFNTLFKKKK